MNIPGNFQKTDKICVLYLLVFILSLTNESLNGQSIGGTWEVFPDFQTNTVYGVHEHKGLVYRGGWFSLFLWNNNSWEIFGGGISGDPGNTSARDLISYPSGTEQSDSLLVIGGNFYFAGTLPVGSIASWDGMSFSTFGAGVNGEIESLVIFNGDLIAGGRFTMAGSTPVNNIARWDGMQWNSLGSGVFDVVPGSADGVIDMVVWNDQLYVAGDFTHAGNNILVNYVACWNGLGWTDVGGGMTLIGYDFTGMRGIAAHDNLLVVVGAFDLAGQTEAINVAGWDGEAWHAFPPGPDPFDDLFGLRQAALSVESYNGLLYVGADFTNTAGDAAQALAVWKNGHWQAVDEGLTGENILGPAVYDMKVIPNGDSSSMLLGGAFDYANGRPTDQMARYTTQTLATEINEDNSNGNLLTRVYPNPLSNSATYEYELREPAMVSLIVYSHFGQRIETLVNNYQQQGKHQVTWEAKGLPAGIYFYRLQAGEQQATGKMVVLR